MTKTQRNEFLGRLIGKPYKLGARGPEEFDCYGLAKFLQHTLTGIEMADIGFDKASTREMAEEIMRNPERALWEEVEHPNDLDLVLMGNVVGRDFHLGTWIVPVHAGWVMHVDEASGVRLDDYQSLEQTGFNLLRFFRRTVQ